MSNLAPSPITLCFFRSETIFYANTFNIARMFLHLISPLYSLPLLPTLVAAIRHGWRIEGCERDYKILPCILPCGPATKRLFNFDPIEISASQTDALAKLEAEACPFFGQVVMGRISLVPFFFRKRKTHAPASAEKSVMD